MNSDKKNKIPEKTEMLLPLEFNDDENNQKSTIKANTQEKTNTSNSQEKKTIILTPKTKSKKTENLIVKGEKVEGKKENNIYKISDEQKTENQEPEYSVKKSILSEEKLTVINEKTPKTKQTDTVGHKNSIKKEELSGKKTDESTNDSSTPTTAAVKKNSKVITLSSPKKINQKKPLKNSDSNISNKKNEIKSNIKKSEKKLIASIKINKDSSIGQILREARVSRNMNIEQIVQITKIKKKFINALEDDNLDDLPAKVYVIAYIKTLAEIYKIPSDTLIEKIKDQKETESLPDDLINHIQEGKQVNIKEEERIKRFLQFAGIALVLLIIVIVLLVYYFSGNNNKKQKTEISRTEKTSMSDTTNESTKNMTTNLSTVTSEDLKIFIYPKPPNLSEAELPKN